MTPEIQLRPYSESGDRDFLFEVFAAAGPALELAGLPESPVKTMLIEQQFRGWMHTYISEFGIDGLQMIEGGLGFIWLFENAEEVRIVDLAFSPAARGKGIGSALVKQIAAQAFSKGKPLRAHVSKTNEGSLRFNLRLGYVVTSETPTHWSIEWRPPQG